MDLQAKVILVLVSVIIPTFLVVTFAENKLTRPLIEKEMQQVGITTAKTLAGEIVSRHWLSLKDSGNTIENEIQQLIYSQPNIVRMDVIVKELGTNRLKVIASNVEDPESSINMPQALPDEVSVQFRRDVDLGIGTWQIAVPIETFLRPPMRRIQGSVQVVVSNRLVAQITHVLWQTTAAAAALSVILLIFALIYFLRRTIANDRKLRRAEDQNVQLMVKLHEAQRQLMNSEKLAAMGQLTASFAHEIGTPLNAIGGHLQLLREEIDGVPGAVSRMAVIEGQVGKIEKIVKNFLASTSKPVSQKQLVDLNRLLEQTLGIVRPRIETIGVEVRRELASDVAPLRAVPLDLEQVLLNLVTNSLDSLTAKKQENGGKGVYRLELATELERAVGKDWARISVYDSGQGIPKSDLVQVTKPFYTTKGPGEGTGLGLAICQDVLRKYGGGMEIESRKGAWTKVTLRIPYQYS